MTPFHFEKLVRQALNSLPKKIRDKLDNVDIVVEQFPPNRPSQFGDQRNIQIFGLYQGVPRTKRTTYYSGVLPDKITIFQKPIEKIGGNSEEKIRQIVKRVVWHEIAHHFGMDEKKVREVEAKKYKEFCPRRRGEAEA